MSLSPLFSHNSRASSKAVAVHEAGHLFVNLMLAPAPWIDAVWIARTPRGQWEGCVEYIHRFQPARDADRDYSFAATSEDAAEFRAFDRDNARRELLVSLAGPVAEVRWRGGVLAPRISAESNAKICLGMGASASSDFGYAKSHIDWLGYPDPVAAFIDAWNETDDMIDREWKRIVRFGSMLKAAGRIDDTALYALPDVVAIMDSRRCSTHRRNQTHGALGHPLSAMSDA